MATLSSTARALYKAPTAVRRMMRRLPRRLPVAPAVIVGALALTAIFAPLIAPHSPTSGNLPDKMLPPFWEEGGSTKYLLGTDRLGRDILSRVIFGARISLMVSLAGILLGGLFGTVLGIVSGYFGRTVDSIIMGAADLALSLPIILLALVLAVVIGPSLGGLILILAFLLWSRYARQTRAEVLSVKEREFVSLARIAGCSHLSIMWRHIFPNVFNTIIVLATLQVGWLIVLEASLSFLGVGVPPPTPSWGSMVADGREFLVSAWWISTAPGVAMLLAVLAMNLLGDWLRDTLDPKLRQI